MIRKITFLILLSLLAPFANVDGEATYPDSYSFESFEVPQPMYRLNDSWIPEHYQLELLILLDNEPEFGEELTAPGNVRITARPAQTTQLITIHANLLQVNYTSMTVYQTGFPNDPIEIVSYDNDTVSGSHFFNIRTGEDLLEGVLYEIYMEFVAPISNDRTNGLYLSTYTDETTGEQWRQAATQMQATHARQMFPCLDEPALKANFDVVLIHKKNYTAIANGELESEKDDPDRPGYVISTFGRTPKMSTYLVAIFVAPKFSDVRRQDNHVSVGLVFPDSKRSFGHPDDIVWPAQIYAREEYINDGLADFALDATIASFQVFNEYFDTPDYPIVKMDSVAVPVKGGAMENWGLIIYREDLLVYKPDETTEAKRYQMADVIAHEVAHQNFGNLITCHWWSVLWLNEGFASFLSTFSMNRTHPEFQPWDQFINDGMQRAMTFDVTANSHPMNNEAETPDQVSTMFSDVTYSKGSCVVRMMYHMLGDTAFQKGLQTYLRDMAFKPVTQDDLFEHLQVASEDDHPLPEPLNVKEVMDTWTNQRGFPLITLTVPEVNTVTISQERFRTDDEGETLWNIPLTLTIASDQNFEPRYPDLWLLKDQLTTSINIDTSGWVMLNVDAIGYYRVLYDQANLDKIIEQLESDHTVISGRSRAQLIDDYFALAFTDRVNVEVSLDLLSYMSQEDHISVWNTLFKTMSKPQKLFSLDTENLEGYLAFAQYFRSRVESALMRVGLEQSPDHVAAQAIHRQRLFQWACLLNSTSCTSYSLELLAEWQSSPEQIPIHQDIRSSVLCEIVKQSNFAFLLEKFQSETGIERRASYFNSLACASSDEDFNSLVATCFDEAAAGRLSQSLSVLQLAASSGVGGFNGVFSLLNDQLQNVIDNFGGLNSVGSLFGSLCQYASSQEIIDQLTLFVEDNSATLEPIRASLDRSLQSANDNLVWMQTYGNNILNYYIQQQP